MRAMSIASLRLRGVEFNTEQASAFVKRDLLNLPEAPHSEPEIGDRMAGAKSTPDYEAMIAHAEAAVAALRDSFRETLAEDIASLEEIFSRLDKGVPPADVLKDIHSIAHNIKGQGGSFGYHLITSIGASLCDYLRTGDR